MVLNSDKDITIVSISLPLFTVKLMYILGTPCNIVHISADEKRKCIYMYQLPELYMNIEKYVWQLSYPLILATHAISIPSICFDSLISQVDVIKWKHFSRYWSFVLGIPRSPVNSSHKGQWRGALIFSWICAWINGWVNNREAGDLRRHGTHYDVIVITRPYCQHWQPLPEPMLTAGSFNNINITSHRLSRLIFQFRIHRSHFIYTM